MPVLKVIKHVTIFTLLLLFSSSVFAEKNEYPKKPDEVLKIALEVMHKRNYNLGAEYYHPDFFKRSSKGIWDNIKDKKPDDIFMADVTIKELDGLKFADGKLVEPTDRDLFISTLIGFQKVMDKMGSNVYQKATILKTDMVDDETAHVEYQIPNLSHDASKVTDTIITKTAILKLLDGNWKIFSEAILEGDKIQE